METKEIKRLIAEIEKVEKSINKLNEKVEEKKQDLFELHDNLRSAMNGDLSYIEPKEVNQ